MITSSFSNPLPEPTAPATRRVHQDREGNFVEDNDPNKHTLFCVPGQRVPVAIAQRLGFVETSGHQPQTQQTQPDRNAATTPKRTGAKGVTTK